MHFSQFGASFFLTSKSFCSCDHCNGKTFSTKIYLTTLFLTRFIFDKKYFWQNFKSSFGLETLGIEKFRPRIRIPREISLRMVFFSSRNSKNSSIFDPFKDFWCHHHQHHHHRHRHTTGIYFTTSIYYTTSICYTTIICYATSICYTTSICCGKL